MQQRKALRNVSGALNLTMTIEYSHECQKTRSKSEEAKSEEASTSSKRKRRTWIFELAVLEFFYARENTVTRAAGSRDLFCLVPTGSEAHVLSGTSTSLPHIYPKKKTI
jgi:hypothetical protein